MSGDLRAVLADVTGEGRLSHTRRAILAALAVADEPLTATVECPRTEGWGYNEERTCRRCHGSGTVRIGCFTEDVLRERLREADLHHGWGYGQAEVDAIVRALFGGDQ